MKKTVLATVILLVVGFTMNAQEISKNALGVRLGSNNGFGGEISYQVRLSNNNRLELDLGLRNGKDYDGYKITGVYQWVMPLENRFNWYVGVGAGLGSYNFNNTNRDTFIFAAGDIGIEYNFSGPVMISLDYRPEFNFGNSAYNNNGLNSDIALGLRFQF